METDIKAADVLTNEFDSLQGTKTVLVVEDDLTNREILGAVLGQNYDVLYAENGAEAMRVIRSRHGTISLILLDLLMPEMNGQEVLKQIREDAELSRIPVIVLTADQKSEVECLKLGAIDFIPKPYPQPDVILARVQRTIELFEDRQIIRSTERDALTGLYAKEYFFRYSEQFDVQHRDTAMDAIVVDINHFHILNERYGKSFCDDLLKRIAEKVRESILKSGGIVSRKEADTFLIYCPHRSDYEDILHLVSVELGDESGNNSRVHVRMGVYESVDKDIDVERRFDRAKIAADTVHGSFTKTIGYYDEKLNDRELFAEQLIEDFHAALEEKQFQVYFQPKYDISPDKPVLTSAEALIRWDHPELGMISPAKFIPLFESNGLIQQLDHFVWQETARQIREWKDRLDYAVPVSVNVSRVDLYEEDIIEVLLKIVETNGLQPNDMLLEVTESAYTENSSKIIETVNKLRGYGFRIEMDDFGTGYSSLNMISKLPIDAIKLDMGFIRDAFKEGGSTKMLEIIIDIAAYLNVPTIAEGVETEDQYKALRLMGCDIVQGFYFSKPLPADLFETFLLEGKKAKAEMESIRQAEIAREKAKHDEELIAMRRSDEEKVKSAEVADALTEKKIGGIPMRAVNFVLAVLAVIVAVSLYIADGNVNRSYQASVEASNRYSNAQQAAFLMETVSDYLTYQVRSFVINGDLRAMENYFEEINVTKRREQALSEVEQLLESSENSAYSSLALALDYSNELAERELSAMRLWLESAGYTREELPVELAAAELNDAYKALSPEAQRDQAIALVFDDVYMDYKDKIKTNVGRCTEELLQKSKQDVERTSERMFSQLRFQSVLTTVLLVTVLVLVFLESTQVQKPLADLVEGMRNQKRVKPVGAQEMRFVSQTYNEFLENSQKARAQLTYEAAHDPLTGLFNRNAYDLLIRSVDQQHIAILLFDIDRFRKIKDIYGQEISDRVLQRVSSVLKANFRSVDLICRLEKDLFVVIMTRVNDSMHQLVMTKFLQINKMLRDPQGDIPGISVSLGAAFSDRVNPQGNLYTDAQTALEKAKAAGSKSCEIY